MLPLHDCGQLHACVPGTRTLSDNQMRSIAAPGDCELEQNANRTVTREQAQRTFVEGGAHTAQMLSRP